MTNNGCFTTGFAEKKTWKLDLKLLEAIKGVLPPRNCPVIDLGAGIGRTVQALRDAGWDHVEGVDGIEGIRKLSAGLVSEHDLTEPHLWTRLYDRFRPDAAICIECAEHVPQELQDRLWDNIADATCVRGLLIVSVATPGQRGRDHIACQMPEMVASRLGQRGHELDEPLTQKARLIAGKGWDRKLIVTKRMR